MCISDSQSSRKGDALSFATRQPIRRGAEIRQANSGETRSGPGPRRRRIDTIQDSGQRDVLQRGQLTQKFS